MYYTEYTVYARMHRIYTASETKKAGSFVGDVFLRFMSHLKCQLDAASWSIWYSRFPSYSELQQFFQLPTTTTSFSWVPTLTCCGPEEFCRWGRSSSSRVTHLLHILPEVLGGRKVQPPAQNKITPNTRPEQSWLCLVRSWKISRNGESTNSHGGPAPILP